MITKAGVPTYMITVGVSSYGRSFKMTESGCTGPMCTFVGPDSAAALGECTQTAGYSKFNTIALLFSSHESASPLPSHHTAP